MSRVWPLSEAQLAYLRRAVLEVSVRDKVLGIRRPRPVHAARVFDDLVRRRYLRLLGVAHTLQGEGRCYGATEQAVRYLLRKRALTEDAAKWWRLKQAALIVAGEITNTEGRR